MSHLPGHTVGSSQYPLIVHEAAPAHMFTILPQAHLPRPLTRPSSLAPHNTGLRDQAIP